MREVKQRLEMHKASPQAYEAMRTLSRYSAECGLEASLLELVKTRASQINGCAFCIQIHTRDARKLGETEDRLHLLAAWREAPVYTPRERAALLWTEALTLLTEGHAPDAVGPGGPQRAQPVRHPDFPLPRVQAAVRRGPEGRPGVAPRRRRWSVACSASG